MFLVSCVVYHGVADFTKFDDVDNDGMVSSSELADLGFMRTLYLTILLSHIGLRL
ncbi:MAG: hypothetical protein AAF223_21670 [Bacteroidota bacterium]